MILVRLQGGLGNQMFQYAFGKMLAIKNGTELKVDLTLLQQKSDAGIMVVRNFDLDIFELNPIIANEDEITYFNGYPNASLLKRMFYKIEKTIKPRKLIIQYQHEFSETQLNITDNSCIVGRWQSEKYFRDVSKVIYNEFRIKKEYLLNTIFQKQIAESEVPVSVHVRREDVIEKNGQKIISPLVNGNLDVSYYKDAVRYIQSKFEQPKFFIFSENTQWCEENLDFIPNAVLIKPERSKKGMAEDLFMITQCKHHIISNSTFSWWGAWLSENQDKIVVAPKKWSYTTAEFEPPYIIPDTWVKI